MGESVDHVSMRQILRIFFVGILSLIIKVIPRQTTELSGKGTWVAALLAVPSILFLLWILHLLLRHAKGKHLGEIYCDIFGTIGGKILTAIYFLWAVMMMCIIARDYGDRFLATTYQNEVLAIFIAILLVLVFITARGSLRAFGRVGELCFTILLTVIILVILFSASKANTDLQRVVALAPEDILAAVPSVFPYLSMMGLATYSGFLWSSIQLGIQENRKLIIRWVFMFALLLAVLQIAILSTMGIELVPHLQFPLFYLIKNITVFGVFERLESVIIALWVATDYIFMNLLAILCVNILKFLFRLEKTKELVGPLLLLVFAGSLLITSSSFALEIFTKTVVRAGNIILCFGIPILAAVTGKLRRVI